MNNSDEALAVQVNNGNLAAFEELVNRYQKSIFRIAYRMVVKRRSRRPNPRSLSPRISKDLPF